MLQTIYCVHVYYIKVDQLLLLYKKKVVRVVGCIMDFLKSFCNCVREGLECVAMMLKSLYCK